VPVVTNGGDPLGENLANRNLVFKFNFLDDKDLAIRFEKFIITNKNNIMELRKKLNNAEIRNSLSSTSAVISLLDVINSGTKTQYKYNKIILINKLFNLNYNNKNLSSEIEELQNKLIILENERLSLNRDLENLKMLSDEKSKTNNLLDHELSIIYRRPWIYVWKLIKRTFRLS
jgi:predicted nuclease with TOPRIM domain